MNQSGFSTYSYHEGFIFHKHMASSHEEVEKEPAHTVDWNSIEYLD